MYQHVTLSAGVAVEFQEAADFFRILGSPQADATVIFYLAGKEVARAENIGEGYNEKFAGGGFDKLRISSTAGGDFEFVTRVGNVVGYDKSPVGNVEVLNNQGAFTSTAKTVTSASASLVAANAQRRYLEIQNNDPTGSIFVNVAGAAATTANGRKIGPGESWQLDNYAPTGQVFAIGDAASNANVLVVEG